MPHFGHFAVLATVGVMDGLMIEVLVMSSRCMIGLRGPKNILDLELADGEELDVVASVDVVDVHAASTIDPVESLNIKHFLALDRTQAAPQSFCPNDVA